MEGLVLPEDEPVLVGVRVLVIDLEDDAVVDTDRVDVVVAVEVRVGRDEIDALLVPEVVRVVLEVPEDDREAVFVLLSVLVAEFELELAPVREGVPVPLPERDACEDCEAVFDIVELSVFLAVIELERVDVRLPELDSAADPVLVAVDVLELDAVVVPVLELEIVRVEEEDPDELRDTTGVTVLSVVAETLDDLWADRVELVVTL